MVGPAATFVRLLGRPALRVDAGWAELPATRSGAILCYLAYHGGWVGRQELGYLLWPDTSDERALGNLRPLLSRLAREPLGRGLERDRARVRWPVETDLAAFRHAVDDRRWRDAWALVAGELLTGFTVAGAHQFESWLALERATLWPLIQTVGLRAADELAVSAADAPAAATVLAALHRLDPFDDSIARAYLRALDRSGAPGAALAAYDRFRDGLERELGGEPEHATVVLAEAIRARAGTVSQTDDRAPPPAPRSLAGDSADAATTPSPDPLPALPRQLTRFVGREPELAELAQLLRQPANRLLTVLGPGGVGKTRLAIEVASRFGPTFAQGARFVDLSAVHGAEGVQSALERALGIRSDGAADADQRLLAQLRELEVLLVLDNLEHLLDAGGSLIRRVLEGTTRVTVLVTSRFRLGLPGERLFDLAGLTVRRSDGRTPDAVTLLLRSARRLRPHLVVRTEEERAVLEICELLEGMPLALELAAGWVRLLSFDEIAAELRQGSPLLDAPAGDRAGDRHSGMRAVFDQTLRLLPQEQGTGLAMLSVFEGGWTREAAGAVANVGTTALRALLDAALIRRDASGRFTMHPLLTHYARERASALPSERVRAGERHARYYLDLVAAQAHAYTGSQSWSDRAGLNADLPNVRAAWLHAVASDRSEALLPAAQGLFWSCYGAYRPELFTELMRGALTVADPGGHLEARALVQIGCCAVWTGPVVEVPEELTRGLALAEALGADIDVAWALRFIGLVQLAAGDDAGAVSSWLRARDIHTRLQDPEGVTLMTLNLSWLLPTPEETVAQAQEAAALALEHGVPVVAAWSATTQAYVLGWRLGAFDPAHEAAQRSASLFEQIRMPYSSVEARLFSVAIAAAGGAVDQALRAGEEALTAWERDGSEEVRSVRGSAASVLAWTHYLAGDLAAAERACTEALAIGVFMNTEDAAPAHLVNARLNAARGDADAAQAALRTALGAARRAASEKRADYFTSHGPQVYATSVLVAVLACDVELALAGGRFESAHTAAAEALDLAYRGELRPAAAVALAAAARVLDHAGDRASARAVAHEVVARPWAPLDARLSLEEPGGLLDARGDGPGEEPQGLPGWLQGSVGEGPLDDFDLVLRTTERIAHVGGGAGPAPRRSTGGRPRGK